MTGPHVSAAIRSHLAELGPDKKARVLDVADEKRPLVGVHRAAAPIDVANKAAGTA